MTDVMSKLWALATHIALLGHYVHFPHSHELRLHITTYCLIAQENPLRDLGVIPYVSGAPGIMANTAWTYELRLP
jgi:hypothetical protein